MKRNAFAAMAVVVGMGIGGVLSCGDDSSGDDGGMDATADGTTGAGAGDAGALPDALAEAAASADGAKSPDGPCMIDEDCVGDQECLFATGAACGTVGTCMTLPIAGPGCGSPNGDLTACSCDGTPRNQPCNLPTGYTRGDIVHAGPCADGGQVCDPTARTCPDQQICGFRVTDGCLGTAAHCFDGYDPTLPVSGVEVELCGCDGGTATTFPGEDAIVSAPVPSTPSGGPCMVFDAGADAADAADAD